MQTTSHAQARLRQRRISETQLEIVLEYGEWNARGDRLTLGARELSNLLADRRQRLRKMERKLRPLGNRRAQAHEECSQ